MLKKLPKYGVSKEFGRPAQWQAVLRQKPDSAAGGEIMNLQAGRAISAREPGGPLTTCKWGCTRC